MKPVLLFVRVIAQPIFPRQNRRGLIEAGAPAASSASMRGFFPRQNRRGLIEADASRTTTGSW